MRYVRTMSSPVPHDEICGETKTTLSPKRGVSRCEIRRIHILCRTSDKEHFRLFRGSLWVSCESR